MSRGLNGLLEAVYTCRTQPHPIKIDRLHILLLVGSGKADRPAELSRATGIEPTAMSKLLAELTGRGRGESKPPKLLEVEIDHGDIRARRYRLTPDGSQLLSRLGDAL